MSDFNEFSIATYLGILNCMHDYRKSSQDEKKNIFQKIINLVNFAIDFHMIVDIMNQSFHDDEKFLFELEEIVLKRLNKILTIKSD